MTSYYKELYKRLKELFAHIYSAGVMRGKNVARKKISRDYTIIIKILQVHIKDKRDVYTFSCQLYTYRSFVRREIARRLRARKTEN